MVKMILQRLTPTSLLPLVTLLLLFPAMETRAQTPAPQQQPPAQAAPAPAPGASEQPIPGYKDALRLYKKGKYDQSLNKIREIFPGHKNSYDLRILAAANYVQQSNYNQALAHLSYCIKDHPTRWESRLMIAGIYRKMGHYWWSVQNSRLGLQVSPDAIPLRLEIVRSFYLAGRFYEARNEINEILKRDAKNFDAAYMDGLIFMKQNKLEMAEFRFRQAMKSKPGTPADSANLFNNMGFLTERNGDLARNRGETGEAQRLYKEAQKYYEKAVKISPEHPEAKPNSLRLSTKIL